ncbi:MAG: electron-transfer flavoprotein:ubiquinone oxidoreductase [Dehalococcoidales bacterium]|nr:electron-transfer flavoprotein:ubiquinone oxidoreductase [Dehalococcoidales bacterium]
MTEQNRMDVLFVGAGPASLAGAIKLKQMLNLAGRKESVIVIEKADKPGQHNLSGAVFETDVLTELIPNWQDSKDAFITKMLGNKVERDELVFLMGGKTAVKVPSAVVPAGMHHKGDYTLSISEMVNWLSDLARGLGVEIYTGFAARELVMENGAVKGIRLGEKGLNKEGEKQPNYLPGEVLEAKVTVLGEGSLGQLAEDLIKRNNLDKGKNPQISSLGIKEIIRLPEKNNFGTNHVIHTLGFPNKSDVFGGGTLYSMSKNTVAVAVVLGLDWRYCDLDPQRELQIFKSHPFVSKLLEGGETIAYGAKTLPEGGFYSVTGLVADGALIIGDDAGLTNVRKLKGLHYAIKSGILAAEAIFQSIEKNDFSKDSLKSYETKLADSFVMKDLQAARNYRQVFARGGLYLGAPFSLIQSWLPFKLKTEPDYQGMRRTKLNRSYTGGIDRLTAVSLSGTLHREDEPSHISFSDPANCHRCKEDFGCHPCLYFCPAEVYKLEGDDIALSPSNCVHCQTCRTKCPHQTIRWHVPEGGDGPKYKIL